MHTRKLIVIVLAFVGFSQLVYLFFNASIFHSEYERQSLEQMETLGNLVRVEVESALNVGLPISSIGGMDAFLSSVLDTAPELAHIRVWSDGRILFAAERSGAVVHKICIPIRAGSLAVGEIRMGVGDALARQTMTMVFDLLTIVLAGLIITHEVIRFFAIRLMGIPLALALARLNAMARGLWPHPGANMPLEFQPFVSRLGRLIGIRREAVQRTQIHLAHVQDRCRHRGLAQAAEAWKDKLAGFCGDGVAIPSMVEPSQIRPIVFFFFLGANLQASFLPLFSRELLKTPTLLTGLFSQEILMGLPITCYMMTVFGFMLFMGSDLFKRWVNMDHAVGLGAFFTATGLVMGGLAGDIIQLILGRMLTAVGFAFIVIYCKQFIVEHSAPEQRSFHLAGFTAAFSGGLFCSVIMGSILAEYFSHRFVFFASAGVVLLIYVFDYMIRDDKTAISEPSPAEGAGLGAFFRTGCSDINLICIFVHGIFTRITFIGFFYFSLPIFLKADFAYGDIGRIMMFYSLPSVLFAGALNRRIKRIRQSKASVTGSNILVGVCLLLFSLTGQAAPWIKAGYGIFSLLVLGISNSITFPAQSSLLMNTRTAASVGSRTTLSVYSSFERIGSSLGPVFYGYFAARGDITHAIVMGGVLCILGNLIFFCFFNPKTLS